MFGAFRYLLSSMVVLTHMWPSSMRWAGYYAVFSFFILSGYLMTLVLNERYGFSPGGVGRFLANRAMRIYPLYWVALAASIALVYSAPGLTGSLNVLMKPPAWAGEWGANIFIFGASFDRTLSSARLIPPVWSLQVELVYYIALALLLARSGKLVAVWIALGAGYTLYSLFNMDFHARYYSVLAGSLAFSLGAGAYYMRKSRLKAPPWLLAPVAAAFAANVLFADRVWPYVMVHGFYASIILTVLLVLLLSSVDARTLPRWAGRADTFLGGLSYPVFLIHWPVAVLVVLSGVPGRMLTEPGLFVMTLLGSTIAAWPLHAVIERRVNGLRDRIRRSRKQASGTSPQESLRKTEPSTGAA